MLKEWAKVISLQGQSPAWGNFILVFPTPFPARFLSPLFLLPPLVNSFLSPSSRLASVQLFLIFISTHCVPGSKMREQGHMALYTGAQEPHSHGSLCPLAPWQEGGLHQRGRSMPSCSRAVTWADPTWEQLPGDFHSLLMYRAANALVHGLLLPRTRWGKKNRCDLNFSSPAWSLVNCCSELLISYCTMILKQHQGKLKSHHVHFTG